MNTLARPQTEQGSHWYFPDGQPCHTVKCTTKDGDRPTTLADAKKMRLVPSVTNILSVLRKPALEAWKQEQVALAVLTTPRLPGEADDAFVQRVLHDERQHDQEAKDAADLGTRIHQALSDELSGRHAEHEMLPWIEPVWEYLNGLRCDKYGCQSTMTEFVVLGDGYGGRVDLVQSFPVTNFLWDFKTTKKLPTKGAYFDHKIQRAAYADPILKPTKTGNIYISTTDPGKFVVDQDLNSGDWMDHFKAFEHLLAYWQIANDYRP